LEIFQQFLGLLLTKARNCRDFPLARLDAKNSTPLFIFNGNDWNFIHLMQKCLSFRNTLAIQAEKIVLAVNDVDFDHEKLLCAVGAMPNYTIWEKVCQAISFLKKASHTT